MFLPHALRGLLDRARPRSGSSPGAGQPRPLIPVSSGESAQRRQWWRRDSLGRRARLPRSCWESLSGSAPTAPEKLRPELIWPGPASEVRRARVCPVSNRSLSSRRRSWFRVLSRPSAFLPGASATTKPKAMEMKPVGEEERADSEPARSRTEKMLTTGSIPADCSSWTREPTEHAGASLRRP